MSNLRAGLVVVVAVLSGAALAQRGGNKPTPPAELRPDGLTVGVGAGWVFPRSILEPNAVSVRIKLDNTLAFEPVLNLGGGLGGAQTTGSINSGGNTTTDTDEDTNGGLNLGLGGNVRYSFLSAGPVDFVGIGGVSFNYGSSTVNRDVQEDLVDDFTTTTSIGAALNWGIGVEWFITRNVVLSADAFNPLVSWSTSTVLNEQQDRSGGEPVTVRDETVSNNLQYGLILQPTVRMMFHLYF